MSHHFQSNRKVYSLSFDLFITKTLPVLTGSNNFIHCFILFPLFVTGLPDKEPLYSGWSHRITLSFIQIKWCLVSGSSPPTENNESKCNHPFIQSANASLKVICTHGKKNIIKREKNMTYLRWVNGRVETNVFIQMESVITLVKVQWLGVSDY